MARLEGMFDTRGKSMIAGGASGIGGACAEVMADQGARVRRVGTHALVGGLPGPDAELE